MSCGTSSCGASGASPKSSASVINLGSVVATASWAAVGVLVGQQLGYDLSMSALLGGAVGFGLTYTERASSKYYSEENALIVWSPVLGGASLLYVYPMFGLTTTMSALVGAALGYGVKYYILKSSKSVAWSPLS